MKTLTSLAITLILSLSIFAMAKAYWTGKSKYGTSVTGKSVVSCEYSYNGQKFWKTFEAPTCPNSIDVY